MDGGQTLQDKPVFIEKSISCESPNGSRMTLVRGDNFKVEDISDTLNLANKLSDYFSEYEASYYLKSRYIASKHPYSDDYTYTEYVDYINKLTFKEIGEFHQTNEFKSIQKDFRRLNCKLTYAFPKEYKVEGYI